MQRALWVLLAIALMMSPADARPRHHRHGHHRVETQSAPAMPFFSGGLVDRARPYIGKTAHQLGLPARLWCADFMNMLLGGWTGSRIAKSYLNYGTLLDGPRVGAIAVIRRGHGGHVGVVSGIDANGNPIVISGNHGRKVGESSYPRSRVIAYRAAP